MNAAETPLEIGALPFDGQGQIDLAGPFEAQARIPDAKRRRGASRKSSKFAHRASFAKVDKLLRSELAPAF